MLNRTEWKGIYPALLTPFTQNDTINERSLRQLIQLNLRKGVQGFYACGSTAEAFMLSVEQRKRLLEMVVDEVAGRAKVIAHIGAISQLQAVDLAKHANGCGVDMISSIPPFYYGFPFEQIRDYYFALADATDKPVLIYHFPANSGVQLTADKVDTFLQDKRFAGIKFTSSDFFMLEQIRSRHPNALVFNGYDEMFLGGLAMGADGGIGSTYNFMAEKFRTILRLYQEGRMQEAFEVQQQANRVITALIRYGVTASEKAALSMMGIDMGECLKPTRSLSGEEKAELKKVLCECGCLNG